MEDRNSRNGARSYRPGSRHWWGDGRHWRMAAAMEPGLIDRDHPDLDRQGRGARDGRNGARSYRPGSPPGYTDALPKLYVPQWSPVLSTGITARALREAEALAEPQWSPVLSTGITHTSRRHIITPPFAAMEPGLIDRDHCRWWIGWRFNRVPQWSPVLSTGITQRVRVAGDLCTGRNGARSYRPGSHTWLVKV